MNIDEDLAEDEELFDFLEDENGGLNEQTLTVREVNDAISEAVSDSFPHDIWVRGEVQRLRFHSSGHIYFDLVDSSSGKAPCTIPVTLLKWNAGKIIGNLREILVEDREVRILARPDFYAPYGKMSLAASNVDAAYTLGQIAIARRELIAKLTAEGILRSNGELELPELCSDIALVTSIDSAAYHDVVDQLKGSRYGFRIHAVNALMQGHDSPASVMAGLKYADTLDVDVVLLCRGGGAKSDLATFDSEKVARTIAAMNTPVITGLGHQIDVSVADIVAHSTLKTPTACAQFMIERTTEALDVVTELGRQIDDVVTEFLTTSETRLANISQRLSDVSYVLERSSSVLENAKLSIAASTARAFENAKESLASLTALISAHDPMRVLERGYSLTTNEAGETIRSIKDLKKGATITTRVVDGEIISTVDKTEKG